jgi:DUF438 domain-containing protein
MPNPVSEKDKLFKDVSDLFHKKPVEDVIPILITASARALVTDSGIDMEKLARNYNRFVELLASQVTDMANEDAEQAEKATRQ